MQCVLLLSPTSCVDCRSSEVNRVAVVEGYKHAFLAQLADSWVRAGYPIQWQKPEWKFDEIEPNWGGALAALRFSRSQTEIAQADAFFSAMPIDKKIDPDIRRLKQWLPATEAPPAPAGPRDVPEPGSGQHQRRMAIRQRLHKCAPAQPVDQIQPKLLNDLYVRLILASGCIDMADGVQWSRNDLAKYPSEVD